MVSSMAKEIRTGSGITPELAQDLIVTAGRAPSLHNSQPWQFRLDGAALEMRVDPQRALRISDPTARELVISCGAALYNLRIALRGKGLNPLVELLPDRDEPLLLARITASPGPGPTPEESRLVAAVTHRHTHRQGFTAAPLAATLVSRLESDVEAEGARLVWVDDRDRVRSVVQIALLADQVQAGSAEWQAEMARWVTSLGHGRRDGIPIEAIPPSPPLPATDRLPIRSFVAGPLPQTKDDRPRAAGRIAVLTTAGDALNDWLLAGQALERMLADAAAHWVFATYATAPLEVPSLRQAVRDALLMRDHPQMMIELGHAGSAQTTPRLPLGEQERG